MESAEKLQESPSPSTEEISSDAAIQSVIRKYAIEAAWPSSNSDQMKNLLFRMATEIASLFGKSVDQISIEDLGRMQRAIEGVCSKFGIHKLTYKGARNALELFQTASASTDLVRHAYCIGSAFAGNFGPIIRRYGLQIAGEPLARAAGVWVAGQAIAELYRDEEKFQKTQNKTSSYHPIFESLILEQMRELALLLGIDARVAWDRNRLRKEIFSEINSAYHNKISALWSDAPPYKALLICLCGELEIKEFQPTDSEETLEQRLIARIVADSMRGMTPEQLRKYEAVIKAQSADNYWSDSIISTAYASGIVIGNLSGFGLYIAASSGLAALGKGLGLTFAFTTYTTLSSALSLVFGPVGIASAATVAAFQWTKARPRKALPFVLYLASARGYLEASNRKRSIWDRLKMWVLRIRLRAGRLG